MKFIRAVFTACSLLCGFVVSAQKISDGYIVLAGDKYQYGMVRLDDDPYKVCHFKSSGTSEFKNYEANDVQGYGVINGVRFVTQEVETSAGKRRVFLKAEAEGTIKLYSYYSRIFIDRGGLLELTSLNYKGILPSVMSDCKRAASFARNARFNVSSLVETIHRYVECVAPAEAAKKYGVAYFVEVTGGVELHKKTISFDQPQAIMSGKPLTDRTLASFGVNVGMLGRASRMALTLGLYYYDQRFYKVLHATDQQSGAPTSDKFTLHYQEIVIPVKFHYNLAARTSRVQPFLTAGVSVPITINSSTQWVESIEKSDGVFISHISMPQKFNQLPQPGLSVGATVELVPKIKNVIEVMYQTTGGRLEGNPKLVVHGSRLVILLGIRF